MAERILRPADGARWRHHVALVKARKVFELYVGHYGSIRDIAEHPQVKLSQARVHQIIAEGMSEVSSELTDLKTRAFDVKLVNLRELKGEARAVLTRRCPICQGTTSEFDADPCEACADTGRFYELRDRMQAADRLLRAMDQESRLLREYTDERPKPPTVRASLLTRMAELPEDELDEIIEMYREEPESEDEPPENEPTQ